jgi:RNA exonuclease 1
LRNWDLDRIMTAKFAVAIDCEMGTARNGDSELIRLSAIDYLTGKVLINNLVKPDQPMLHLNTKWSGVYWDQMNEAIREKTTLKGKASHIQSRNNARHVLTLYTNL